MTQSPTTGTGRGLQACWWPPLRPVRDGRPDHREAFCSRPQRAYFGRMPGRARTGVLATSGRATPDIHTGCDVGEEPLAELPECHGEHRAIIKSPPNFFAIDNKCRRLYVASEDELREWRELHEPDPTIRRPDEPDGTTEPDAA